MQICLQGNEGIVYRQCIYHVRRVCPSASYTSQAIDCKYHTRMQPLYSTVHEAPQSRFHLVRSSTIVFTACQQALLLLRLAAIIAAMFEYVQPRRWFYIASTTILLYTQPFHSDLHLRRQTSLAYGLACFVHFAMFAMKAAFQDPGCSTRFHPKTLTLQSCLDVRICSYI